MAKVDEGSAGQLQASLDAGIRSISADQEIEFIKYNRAILPVDGYVFWVRDANAIPIKTQGSLHYDTDQQQRADEIIGLNKVVFTTQSEVQDFNAIADQVVWIGAIDSIRFAFTSRGKKYKEAGTYHYRGDAIYPVMYPQILENPQDALNLGGKIATNSMPLWLGLNAIMPIYPAYLVSSNLRPPYAAIDIESTEPLTAMPEKGSDSTSMQLVKDRVKIIVHGLRNDAAIDYLNYIIDQSLIYETMGILNSPSIMDEKRGQSELGILAQKKSLTFEISYMQSRNLATARKLISSASITLAIDPFGVLDYYRVSS
jgi:hypothetical protein